MTAAIAPSNFAVHSPTPVENRTLLNLLIVDDERGVREACREAAATPGYRASGAESSEQALRLINSQDLDVILLDLKLPGAGGMEVLRQIKQHRPDIEVIVVTGHGTVQSAVQAMKAGAYDFVTKPFSLEELKLLLERVGHHLKLKTENRMLREKIKSKQGFGSIIGRAPEMDKLYPIIAKAAHSLHPVLILGESGTGKEMVARAIHYSGPFRDKPFIPVDCGSLVPTLIESELFGYVKVRSPGRCNRKKDYSQSPRAARCSWTKLASCQWTCKPRCCVLFRKRKSGRWEAQNRFPSMSASWRQQIAIWSTRLPRALSAAICIFDSMFLACATLHYASAGKTSLCWRRTFLSDLLIVRDGRSN